MRDDPALREFEARALVEEMVESVYEAIRKSFEEHFDRHRELPVWKGLPPEVRKSIINRWRGAGNT